MQAFLSSHEDAPDLDSLNTYHNKVFSQFIDGTVSRLEGHLTSDKIVYKQGDTVFVDLLVLNSLDLSPLTANTASFVVSLYDNTGNVVEGLSVTLTSSGPAFGLTLRLPDDIAAGNYLIVANSTNMATATRTIVVQALPVETVTPAITGAFNGTWTIFETQVPAATVAGHRVGGKVNIVDSTGAPFSN
jgi:hypothetical protein